MKEKPSGEVAARDAVLIRDLKVPTVIGVHPWERLRPQALLLELELGCDAARAARHDAIGDALDYEAVAKRVVALGAAESYQLLESFAERVAAVLQDEFGVARVVLTVRKPGALREAREVGVRIVRERGR
jgi:dihydroneopterin aldolase